MKVGIEGAEVWSKDWILHHDNAPAHNLITEMEHPTYSLDLAPNGF
jgi:hypothetical protein